MDKSILQDILNSKGINAQITNVEKMSKLLSPTEDEYYIEFIDNTGNEADILAIDYEEAVDFITDKCDLDSMINVTIRVKRRDRSKVINYVLSLYNKD